MAANELTLFIHPDFGNLRTVVEGETIYVCARCRERTRAQGHEQRHQAAL